MSEPKVSITNIIWSFDRQTNHVNLLLVRRADAPFADYWALPETSMRADESADEAALRLVREKIGLNLSGFHTEQLATFTQPNRTPAQREISLAYMTFLPEMPTLSAGYGATEAQWFNFDYHRHYYVLTHDRSQFSISSQIKRDRYYAKLEKRENDATTDLAFDHDWILSVACRRITNKLDYQPNILLILGPTFTLKEARTVYAVFQQVEVASIDNSNFKKNHRHIITSVGTSAASHPGRPAKLFQLAYL